jgi:hypothetical protein
VEAMLIDNNEFYLRLEVLSRNFEGKLVQFNLLQRLQDNTYIVLTCDVIDVKNPSKYFLDQRGYFFDAIKYDSGSEAIGKFLERFPKDSD